MLDQIPAPREPRSLPEEIFLAHRKGELDAEGFNVAMSVWTADNAWKFRANPYPPLPNGLVGYVEGRIQGRMGRDGSQAMKLGQWVRAIHKLIEDNRANLETLIWARGKCEGVGMRDMVRKLEAEIQGYQRLAVPSEIRSVLDTQALDADARRNEG